MLGVAPNFGEIDVMNLVILTTAFSAINFKEHVKCVKKGFGAIPVRTFVI